MGHVKLSVTYISSQCKV